MTASKRNDSWADWAGMLASIGCAVHCAVTPLFVAYLPAMGLAWLADSGFHRWMAVLCFGLATAAFVPGLRKHGSFVPAVLGGVGVLLLMVAAFGVTEGCCSACCGVHAKLATGSAASDVCVVAGAGNGWFAAVQKSQYVMPLVKLMTPLGGVVLVIAHVLNHQLLFRCRSSCCQAES